MSAEPAFRPGTSMASATGLIASDSMTALTLPGSRMASSPLGSCAGTVPLARACATAAVHADMMSLACCAVMLPALT